MKKSNSTYDFIIVGAGLAGSTLARLLHDHKYKVKVVDKRPHIAGNCYTDFIENIHIHKYGPHIFHTSNFAVWDFVNRFASFNNFINSPIAIGPDNVVYNMPFNMNTFVKMFTAVKFPDEAKAIIQYEIDDYFKDGHAIENLEDQAISLVGVTIYNKLVKGYTEKQWGKDCKDLDPSIIKRLPVRYTYNNNYFDDLYQGVPVLGYTDMIENMLNGIDVELNVDFITNRDKLMSHTDRLIYTGKIDEFYDYKFGELDYRSLRFQTERLCTENYQGNAVVNYTGRTPDYTRIVEHKHFNNDKSQVTYITLEFPEKSGEPFYPLSDARNINIYQKYKKLSELNSDVIFAGRLGKYKYFDMDDVIEDCFKIFQDILKLNAWEEDYE